MLQTVEAKLDASVNITLLEPLRVSKKSRAIVTVLEESNGSEKNQENSKKILELLRSFEFANRKSYSAEEIET